MIDIDDFKKEVSCEYKGETYSVRDNGAIMRHPKKGCRVRSLDNQWTFGKKNKTNGYMFLLQTSVSIKSLLLLLGT